VNVLFIGQKHRINDPRLAYREIRVLKKNIPGIEIYFFQYSHVKGIKKNYARSFPRVIHSREYVAGITVQKIIVEDCAASPFDFWKRLSGFNAKRIIRTLEHFFGGVPISVIQASDVRELAFAAQLGKVLKSRIFYDSHEDYIRQAIDYRRKSLKAYIKAATFLYIENKFIRDCDHVFCADESLKKKYTRKHYAAKKVALLRNFPVVESDARLEREYKQTKSLKLVYIGGVNKYRGVIEAAQYTMRFNEKNIDRRLHLTVYSTPNKITRYLEDRYGVTHHEWIDYAALMKELDNFDVGICLWLPIKKFHLNLPLKNFDYMSVGLPFITSNFGNLQKYVQISGSGLCIDPTSYLSFEQAAGKLFDSEYRRQLGENGFEWTKREGNFLSESVQYFSAFLKKDEVRPDKEDFQLCE
jgi:glycosyltransferase involved in cell wall biosynthesis